MKLHIYDKFGISRIDLINAQLDTPPKVVRIGERFFAYERPIWDAGNVNADAAYRECDVFIVQAAEALAKKRNRK